MNFLMYPIITTKTTNYKIQMKSVKNKIDNIRIDVRDSITITISDPVFSTISFLTIPINSTYSKTERDIWISVYNLINLIKLNKIK